MTEAEQRRMSRMLMAVKDALNAAASIAMRASDEFAGTKGCLLFQQLGLDIASFGNDTPSVKAIQRASHASMIGATDDR